jgi:hypothetical protein
MSCSNVLKESSFRFCKKPLRRATVTRVDYRQTLPHWPSRQGGSFKDENWIEQVQPLTCLCVYEQASNERLLE